MFRALIVVSLCGVVTVQTHSSKRPLKTLDNACTARASLTVSGFESVMRRIADAWNGNNARAAVDCFTGDAIYSAPPSGRRMGKAALFDFFGGKKGRESQMHMTWHYLVFDPSQQVGAGEYTFRYKIQDPWDGDREVFTRKNQQLARI